MSEASNILFTRSSNQNNNEEWDDSALIRAYDRAVGKIKYDLSRNKVSDTEKKNSKKQSKKNVSDETHETSTNIDESDENDESLENNKKDWKVDDRCYAVYTDGLTYPAKVVSVNPNEELCVIKYDYYNNEEEKHFSELSVRFEHYESFQTLTAEEDDSKLKADTNTKEKKKKFKNKKPKNERFDPTIELQPPPPPPLDQSAIMSFYDKTNLDDPNDAFYSMLMSWYISGYHTGYYFGLTQKKNDNTEVKHPKNNRSKKKFSK